MTVWSSVPRPSKCIGVAIVIVFGLVMIIFCLPLDDTAFTFYLPAFFVTTNDSESLSFQTSSTISSYEVTNAPRSSNNILSDIIGLTSNKSLKSATPLLVLDQTILMCTKDSNECEKLNKQKRFIFGIFGENTLSVDQTKLPLNAATNWTTHVYDKHFVFKKFDKEIIIAVIERRPNYWYVDGLSSLSLFPFALLPPKNLSTIVLENNVKLLIPDPLNDTIRNLNRSQFLQCNLPIAKKLRKKYPSYYSKSPIINDSLISHMAYMRDLLLDINITPFLFGGTLLGWYRECGIIPYTTDLDFSALASEYKPILETRLKNDQRLKLYWILGKPDDSLEYSVYVKSVKIDLFFLYETENSSWVGGMVVWKKAKLRWTYPKLEHLCTADLKGHLFNVPCNVEEFLKADYGANWFEPHHDSNFVWYQSHNNVKETGKWSLEEWHNVYRTFS